MKHINFALLIFAGINAFAQTPPEAFNYSSVIRGSSGQALPNKQISFRFTILAGGSAGTIVYQETHNVTTDQWSTVNLSIGKGSATSGVFSSIEWGSAQHFVRIEVDDRGGSTFELMGTVQFLSVPYALHSKSSSTTEHFHEKDPVFEVSTAVGISADDTTRWGQDEIDPIFNQSVAKHITAADTARWSDGMISETDPSFKASLAWQLTAEDTARWGNPSITETDPLFESSFASKLKASDTVRWAGHDSLWHTSSQRGAWRHGRTWLGDSSFFYLDNSSQLVVVDDATINGYPISTYTADPARASAIVHWTDNGQGWLLSGINGPATPGTFDGVPHSLLTRVISRGNDFVLGPLEGDLYFVPGGTVKGVFTNDGDFGIGTKTPSSKLTVAGTIESTSGGIKFPDGTIQTTAAASVDIQALLDRIAELEVKAGISATDIDGNSYPLVTIGPQVWMKENLRVSHFRNGDAIPTTTVDPGETTDPYQWVYNNDESNLVKHGRLYNWYTVIDSRKICPTGFHVPTDGDWNTLISYLGGSSVAGGKVKEAGLVNWISPNVGASNETGLTILPSGAGAFSTFLHMGESFYQWSENAFDSALSLVWRMSTNHSEIQQTTAGRRQGYSMRCVRD